MDELRKTTRFNDFGKVECEQISLFPGTLGDISLTGIKVAFDSNVDLNMDDEYEINVRLSKFNGEPIKLLVMPVWRFDDNSNGSTVVQIGFSILPSLDFNKLYEYIAQMDEADAVNEESRKNENRENITVQVVMDDIFQNDMNIQDDTQCQFL